MGSSTREILFSFLKVHDVESPNIELQLQGLNESIRAVVAGYGVMLAPSLAVQEHLDRNKLEGQKSKELK